MPDSASHELNPLLRWYPWRVADPAVLLESILEQLEAGQRQQVIALYLDSVTASMEANLKFVQGLRSVVAGARK
jgi:hypothetical protein